MCCAPPPELTAVPARGPAGAAGRWGPPPCAFKALPLPLVMLCCSCEALLCRECRSPVRDLRCCGDGKVGRCVKG
eukprot:scaffold12149_cov16-Tisochrysis_lutea.AAC.1